MSKVLKIKLLLVAVIVLFVTAAGYISILVIERQQVLEQDGRCIRGQEGVVVVDCAAVGQFDGLGHDNTQSTGFTFQISRA